MEGGGGENVSSRMTPSESLLLLEAIKEKGYNKMPICPLKSWKCQHSGAIPFFFQCAVG